jgi:hypothetical protein
VLNQITNPDESALDFGFDLLGRMLTYDTAARESTFDYDGSKRLGDYDNSTGTWKRYHSCKRNFLAVEDATNTYYILYDKDGSTKVIFTDSGVVNRVEYDCLGYIRNKTTDLQVELLWKRLFSIDDEGYFSSNSNFIIKPILGRGIQINSSFIVPLGKPANQTLQVEPFCMRAADLQGTNGEECANTSGEDEANSAPRVLFRGEFPPRNYPTDTDADEDNCEEGEYVCRHNNSGQEVSIDPRPGGGGTDWCCGGIGDTHLVDHIAWSFIDAKFGHNVIGTVLCNLYLW